MWHDPPRGGGGEVSGGGLGCCSSAQSSMAWSHPRTKSRRRGSSKEPQQCRGRLCRPNSEVRTSHRDSGQRQSTISRVDSQLKRLQVASTSPIGERLDACQRFVERARKRHAAAQEAVKVVEIQSEFEVEVQEEATASHTSSMRVDPPDEVVALRKRISELEEEAQSRVRAPQEDELPATVHVSTAAEINQLRVTVQDLQRERDFLRSEMAKNRARSTSANYDFGQLFFSSSAISTSANFDFGQFRLRPISTSANFDFGQFRLQPISISANFDFGQFLDVEFWDDKGWGPEGWRPQGWGPEGWGPEGWGPEGWALKGEGPKGGGPNVEKVEPRRVEPRRVEPRRVEPRRVGAQNFALFFSLFPPQFSFFFLSLGVLFVEFWWCLKRRGPEMCTFGVLGLSCASPVCVFFVPDAIFVLSQQPATYFVPWRFSFVPW